MKYLMLLKFKIHHHCFGANIRTNLHLPTNMNTKGINECVVSTL